MMSCRLALFSTAYLKVEECRDNNQPHQSRWGFVFEIIIANWCTSLYKEREAKEIGYLFGAHWFTVGFVAASAIFQYPFLSLFIVIAQLLPAITACIGTLIIFIREQKSYSDNRGNYEF